MSCRFCACQNHVGPAVTFVTADRSPSSSPQQNISPARSTNFYAQAQTQTQPQAQASDYYRPPSTVYQRNGERLGRQISGGGGTTTESVVFPRGDAFIMKEGRGHSPPPVGTESRGHVPSNIVKNTSHRRFVQSLRSPTSYACAAHTASGGADGMRMEHPGPRVPDSLRQRERDLQLAARIRKNNGPATRNAAKRQQIAAAAPSGPIARSKQRPQQSRFNTMAAEGRRRYDPPSSGPAARAMAEAPVAPAPRDLMAAADLGLRRDDVYADDDDYEIGPSFRVGRVRSPSGYCPPTDRNRSAGIPHPSMPGGGGGGGGGRGGGVGALSPSTIKPTRVYYEQVDGEAVEAVAYSSDEVPVAANGMPLRRLYALERPRSASAAAAASSPRRGGGGGAGVAGSPSFGSDRRGYDNYGRVRSPNTSNTLQQQRVARPSTAADVAAWRRRYYPDGINSVRRHFYDDPNRAPPVCDRCCCKCCCEPGCETGGRHKPGASGDCLWWYS